MNNTITVKFHPGKGYVATIYGGRRTSAYPTPEEAIVAGKRLRKRIAKSESRRKHFARSQSRSSQ